MRHPWPLCVLAACATAVPTSTPTPTPPPPPPLPAAVDLKPQFLAFALPPRAQGHRPTCSVFTVTAAIEFAAARATGHGERLSVEYLNWAANAANNRHDDGDFFHFTLSGYARFGACPEAAQPYAKAFVDAPPPPDALVAGGAFLARHGGHLVVRWIKPIGTGIGLDADQFADAKRTLAAGWPVAAGSGHSRLLVGYRDDAARPGGGVFATLDSALAAFAEVDYAFVQTQVNDAFVVEVAP